MNELQALLYSIIQGITELFPVSSLGHAVIIPALLRWPIDQGSEEFLPFLVVLHAGTALALLIYFWRDWWRFLFALLGYGANAAAERRVFLMLVVATIPVVLIGFAFEKALRGLFGQPIYAAAFLVANGFILLIGEFSRGTGRNELAELTVRQALGIGLAQGLALFPGISRSGVTMIGGVLAGLRHEAAARFSFLLGTPVILGATVLEAPKLLHAGTHLGGLALLAGAMSGVVAFVSIAVLMRYFRTHEVQALNPFAYYCVVAGLVALGVFVWR